MGCVLKEWPARWLAKGAKVLAGTAIKDGVSVQIDPLQDLAWSDAVRRLAISLNHNIRRLWPD
ncbi:MAG: hypothetical protein ACR2RF_22050 [Geminicoccaceae bacterium]